MVDMRTPVADVATPPSSYVDTMIAKVAETPLEGSSSFADKEFGPFEMEDAAMMNKMPNKKGYSVRFEKPGPDPIEKAFDSIFLFYDDVREATETLREDGAGGCGMDLVTERLAVDTDFTQTLECVTEGLCRNPCVDHCSKMPAPVDLMLTVEDDLQDEHRDHIVSDEAPVEPAPAPVKPAPAPVQVQKVDFILSKENSVKDMIAVAEEAEPKEEEPKKEEESKEMEQEAPMPLYTPVETVMDKMKAMLSENVLNNIMDAFDQQAVESKAVGANTIGAAAVQTNSDEDPIVEAIDTVIFFFEDLQENLAKQKDALIKKMEVVAADFEPHAKSDDNTVLSQVTVETANTKIKSLSTQMAPDVYAEALENAASILSENAPEEDLKAFSKEELHQRALEKIMAERDEEFAQGEYKTEEMILNELMYNAEQAIMGARSKSVEGQEVQQRAPPEMPPKEALIVLGHSATLTPIPEADEGSTGTPPTSEKIEEGVMDGTIPEVPLLPLSTDEQSGDAVDTESSVLEDVAKEEEPASKMEAEEPLLIKVIDGMFLCYDDIQEQKPCSVCFGHGSVPSDLVDPSDEIVEREIGDVTKEELFGEKAAEFPVVPEVAIEPRPDALEQAEISEGQLLIQEALQVVQEASRMDSKSDDELRIAKSKSDEPSAQDSADPVTSLMDQIQRATFNLMGMKDDIIASRSIEEAKETEKDNKIIGLVDAAFDKNDEQRMAREQKASPMQMQPGKVEFEIPESLKNGHQQDPYVTWGGDDSELMSSINADRKLSEMEHVNIFRDVSKGLHESSGGIITRTDNQEVFLLHRTHAFMTAGNSSSADLVDIDDKFDDPAQAALKILCAEDDFSLGSESSADQRPQLLLPTESSGSDAAKMRESGKKFSGWSMNKKREETLRARKLSL